MKYLILYSAPFKKMRRTLWYLRTYEELSTSLKFQCDQLGINVVTRVELTDTRLTKPRTLNEAKALATELGFEAIKYQNINWRWRKHTNGDTSKPGGRRVSTP